MSVCTVSGNATKCPLRRGVTDGRLKNHYIQYNKLRVSEILTESLLIIKL